MNLHSVNSENIVLYPNPGKGVLHAKGLKNISSISLSTIDGKIILSKKIEGNKTTLNTDSLKNGMYLVILHKKLGISAVKIIVVND